MTPANRVVVVAEDYADISQLMGDILRDEGYQVAPVTRGAEVVETVAHLRPVLLLLDLSLPDVSGNDILQTLQTNPATRHVPVVVVSAYTEQLRKVPQVRAVVNKPFDINTLLEAVQQAQRPLQERAK
jgi:two-component system phosphate regulon response regulator PhoB